MQDRTINSALLALRKQGGQQGMLAEVILGMRGVDTPNVNFYIPMRKTAATRIILEALKECGPSTASQMARVIHKELPHVSYRSAYNRAYLALLRLRERDLVVRNGDMWRLAQ